MIARSRGLSLFGYVAVFLTATAIARAEVITVPNFSFEEPSLIGTGYEGQGYSGNIPSWENAYGVFGELFNVFPSHDPIVGGEGNQAGWLAGFNGSFTSADASQMWTNTTSTFEAGKSYQLNVGVSRISYAPGVSGASLDLWLYYLTPEGTFGGVIGSTTATYDTTSTSTLTDFTVDVPALASDHPAVGGKICTAFLAMNNPGDTMCWVVDNVRITAVPEPSTIFLLSIGLIGLGCYAWRKQ
jgi:hypothetical protein